MSSNLVSWTLLATNVTSTGNTIQFQTNAVGSVQFYRVQRSR